MFITITAYIFYSYICEEGYIYLSSSGLTADRKLRIAYTVLCTIDHTDSTGELMKAIRAEDKAIRTAEFVNFLETVKESHYRRLLKYYEKIGEDRYTYIGSYDFRITAVAKVLEIDKAAIADSKFIAADLL